jgi:hypothetical protein
MENGECPQEWLLALGGGGGERLLGREIRHNRTGGSASIMLGTKSEPAALLLPICEAMTRTRSLDTADPTVCGGAVGAHDVDAVGPAAEAAGRGGPSCLSGCSEPDPSLERPAARREGERGVGNKNVGHCDSTAMEQGGGAIGQTKKLVDTINEYKQNAANMQARLKNMQAMLARFADKEKESKKKDEEVKWSAEDRTRPLRTIKPVYIPKLARGRPQCQRAARREWKRSPEGARAAPRPRLSPL